MTGWVHTTPFIGCASKCSRCQMALNWPLTEWWLDVYFGERQRVSRREWSPMRDV
jgi:hypothetical protein